MRHPTRRADGSKSPLKVRGPLSTAVAAVAAAALVAGTPGAAEASGRTPHAHQTTMTPIGGGYEAESLAGFSRAAEQGATGPTVDIVVVPAAYGDAPEDRADNLRLAQQRVDQIDAACDATVKAPFTGCTAVLAPVLQRSDALNPANAALITNQTDGIYVLGGDQGLAMQIIAESPFETAMDKAFARGANVGGTSAGAAVESTSMLNGYTGDLNPWDGLKRNSSLMWWGDDGDAERGLALGSKKVIYDQHFYQRGRFGRLLSTIATSDDRYKGKSLLGVGVDYATGVKNTGDTTLSGVFGPSSIAILDFEKLHAKPTWKGSSSLLSVRNVVTHLMTKDNTSYALDSRTLTVDCKRIGTPHAKSWSAPRSAARGTLYLGGDVSGDFTRGVAPDFVKTAKAATRSGAQSRIVVLWSGAASDKAAADAYIKGLATAGWTGSVDVIERGKKSTVSTLGAAGAVLVGHDPTQVAASLGDPSFRRHLAVATITSPAVLADRHMAAALGTWYSPKADPTSDNYEDEGIANFRTNNGDWRRGLGLVNTSLVPSLTYDYRWGRLFDLGQKAPRDLAFGIGKNTAIKLHRGRATVVGTGSVVAADPRSGRFWTGSNGAIGAANVLLSTFAPGERVSSR